MLVVGLMMGVCSLFGLPWCVALGAKVQEHNRKTYDTNLEGAFVENTITQIHDWKKYN